ncbi:iron uptake system protein EfeO [Agrococcus jejuensis]|uniref:Iron uptake system component EfeO n=1 Tax=Agrococcus jejuensis TaxID=399736 RepID=A0A1G8CCG3_9MICO|nr:iron uptake system protein EfeO [Agrococcus jejuensis]SDH42883.1 iron uptake system component EfeO [Agrococcus jejuensis]
MNRPSQRVLAAALAASIGLGLAGCVPNQPDAEAIDVAIADGACDVAVAQATAGTVEFTMVNSGSQVDEFEIFADDQLQIVAERENLANDGQPVSLRVQLQPGTYYTACRPGMVGQPQGIAEFTVSGEAFAVDADEQTAIDAYVAYTKSQVSELVTAVAAFTDAYVAGDDDGARRLFPLARQYYERIEPTAEQFGDLDPAIDYRLPGAVAELDEFTGFHRIELDLWLDEGLSNYQGETYVDEAGAQLAYLDLTDLEGRQVFAPLDADGRAYYADRLVADVQSLYDLVFSDDFTLSISDISNGAVGLLDEVAAPDGKLPGEEDEFSHTDLYDFLANVEGAQVAFESVRDLAEASDDGTALADDLETEFDAMTALLATYGSFDEGFVSYDTVGDDERNALAAQLNALAEPLSQLTAVIVE